MLKILAIIALILVIIYLLIAVGSAIFGLLVIKTMSDEASKKGKKESIYKL